MANVREYDKIAGGEALSMGGFGSMLSDFNRAWSEVQVRDSDSIVGARSGPGFQKPPPTWLSRSENVAIDGTKLTAADKKGSMTDRYKEEFAISETLIQGRQAKFKEATNDYRATYNYIRRLVGLDKQLILTEEQARAAQSTKWNTEVEQMERQHSMGGYIRKIPSWEEITEIVRTHRPLAKVAEEYRPRVDVYGVDPFLDSAQTVVFTATKWGFLLGWAHGGLRGTRSVIAQYTNIFATGMSFLALVNISALVSGVKYGFQGLVLSSAFVIGDRAVRYASTVKSAAYSRYQQPIAALEGDVDPSTSSTYRTYHQDHVREHHLIANTKVTDNFYVRGPLNYVVGLGFALSLVGLAPWWYFRDGRAALRYAISGASLGAGSGLLVGILMERLVALNVERISASNRELRRYEALMKRQKLWHDLEMSRRELAFALENKK